MKKLNFTLEHRQGFAERAIEYAGAVKVRVINLNKEAAMFQKERRESGKTMNISFIPVEGDHKEKNSYHTFSRDPDTGIFFGIPFKVHEDGNIQWRRILINESLMMDFNRIDDCKTYLVLCMYEKVEGAPYATDPKYKFYDPDEEAEDQLDVIKQVEVALQRAGKLSGEEMVRFGRFLGIVINSNINSQVLSAKVKKYAYDNPADFNLKYDNVERAYEEVITAAENLGLIKKHHEKGFTFEGFSLGMNRSMIIKTLKENPDVWMSMGRTVNDRDIVLKKIASESGEKESGETKEKTKQLEKESIKDFD